MIATAAAGQLLAQKSFCILVLLFNPCSLVNLLQTSVTNSMYTQDLAHSVLEMLVELGWRRCRYSPGSDVLPSRTHVTSFHRPQMSR